MNTIERYARKRACKIIEDWGTAGYREAAAVVGPDEAEELLVEHVAREEGTTSYDKEVRSYVAGIRAWKGL